MGRLAGSPRQGKVKDMAEKKKDKLPPRAVRIEEKAERLKALNATLAQIEKTFGKGSIMRMDGAAVNQDISVVSTGSLGLDIALGVGGLPRGRVIEVYGPESSGKTTLALQVVAEMQKRNGTCAYLDAEHALDPQYAERIGVDLQKLLISQPDNGEQALDICDALVRSGAVDLIVVDSVAALTPSAELTGEMGDALPGLQARLMSQALRKLTASINRTQCTVLFINQIRMKIGVTYGSPEVTTGGNALKFYSTVRIEIRRGPAIKKGDEILGNETKVKVVKNKVAPPFRTAVFDIMFGEGISRTSEILTIGADLDIVEKSGAWFGYNGQKIGQGKEKACEWLRAHPDAMVEIENRIRAIKGVRKLDNEPLDSPASKAAKDGKDAKDAKDSKDEKPVADKAEKPAAKPVKEEPQEDAGEVEEEVRVEDPDVPPDEDFSPDEYL